MSAISSIGANLPPYQPTSPIAGESKPTMAAEKTAAEMKAAATKSDPDNDGDSDGPGLDVKG